MLFYKIFTKFFEQLSVPLDDSFLLLAALPLHLIVLLLETVEDVLKLVFVGQDLDDRPQEPTVDILDKLLAVDIIDFL